jgi:hypothetical protein
MALAPSRLSRICRPYLLPAADTRSGSLQTRDITDKQQIERLRTGKVAVNGAARFPTGLGWRRKRGPKVVQHKDAMAE